MSIKYIGKTDEVGIPPTKGQSHVYDVTTAPSPTTPRPPPFCDDNPSNNPAPTTNRPTPLCSHFHNPDDISSQTGKSKPKKKSTG